MGRLSNGKDVLFSITIDTEVDKSPDWIVSSGESFTSVTHGIPDLLAPIFSRFGARPTFFLSPEVIEDEDSDAVLRAARDCELGTHLHGDVIEPHRRISKLGGTSIHEMQCSYPKEVEYQKLERLTDLFIDRFGFRPKSFRAGRWGAGKNTIESLDRLDYEVDSSVSPGVLWDYPEGRADFRLAGNQPYRPSTDDITKPGDSEVLEIPASITGSSIRSHLTSNRLLVENPFLFNLLNRAFPLSWVTPVAHPTPRIIHAIERIISQNNGRRVIMVNMTFHSVDIIPRASPAARDEKEGELMVRRIADVLDYAKRRGFKFVTMSEARRYFTS